jgi:hypothetical protein
MSGRKNISDNVRPRNTLPPLLLWYLMQLKIIVVFPLLYIRHDIKI